MDTLQYVILAIIVILIFGPALFADRSPIPETSNSVHKIKEPAELNALVLSTTYVVVDFYADWCPPCRTIAPVFSKLADDYSVSGQLAFAKVNVDNVKDVAKRYNITAMPTFVFFKDGEPGPVAVHSIKQGTAGMPEDGLIEKIQGANTVILKRVVRELFEKVSSS